MVPLKRLSIALSNGVLNVNKYNVVKSYDRSKSLTFLSLGAELTKRFGIGVDEEDIVFGDEHAALRGPPALVLSPFADAVGHVEQDLEIRPWPE